MNNNILLAPVLAGMVACSAPKTTIQFDEKSIETALVLNNEEQIKLEQDVTCLIKNIGFDSDSIQSDVITFLDGNEFEVCKDGILYGEDLYTMHIDFGKHIELKIVKLNHYNDDSLSIEIDVRVPLMKNRVGFLTKDQVQHIVHMIKIRSEGFYMDFDDIEVHMIREERKKLS